MVVFEVIVVNTSVIDVVFVVIVAVCAMETVVVVVVSLLWLRLSNINLYDLVTPVKRAVLGDEVCETEKMRPEVRAILSPAKEDDFESLRSTKIERMDSRKGNDHMEMKRRTQ